MSRHNKIIGKKQGQHEGVNMHSHEILNFQLYSKIQFNKEIAAT